MLKPTRDGEIIFDLHRSLRRFLVVLSGVLLAGPAACSTAPDDASDMTEESADRVIGTADVANLSSDHHLVLDLRSQSYRFDASVFALDLTYVEVVDPSGRQLGIEQLIDQIVAAGKFARGELRNGFTLRTVDDRLEVVDVGPGGASPHEATTQSSLLGAFDIGVIPATPSCPSNSEAIVIHMDDEDGGNANSRSGWVGATVSNSNTTFFFCRVDGQQFHPLTTQFTSTQDHYAVLKLGGTCPNNSLDFARHFDNEDDGNANSSSGNIAPNVSDSDTTLRFCLFRSDATTMTGFPNLGFSYGVFATSVFSRRLATGFVHTDDEDSSNGNSYSADPAWLTDAQRIVSGGANTTLNLARVR